VLLDIQGVLNKLFLKVTPFIPLNLRGERELYKGAKMQLAATQNLLALISFFSYDNLLIQS